METDDIIIIAIIVIRYGIQIYQMVSTIRNTRKNIQIQKNMKDIDLNKTPNLSTVEYGNQDEDKRDDMVRKKIQERQEKLEKKNSKNVEIESEIN